MPTQARLKELLKYNPDTGEFIRLTDQPGIFEEGDIAGSLKAKGYVSIKIDYKDHKAHRLAWLYMTGSFPDTQIDHIDGDRANNEWKNLRLSSPHHNHAVMPVTHDKQGTTKNGKRWSAAIYFHTRKIHLGTFDTQEEAHKAYLEARRQYFPAERND